MGFLSGNFAILAPIAAKRSPDLPAPGARRRSAARRLAAPHGGGESAAD
jgi:hypothetical protein